MPGEDLTEPDARRRAETAVEYGWYSPHDRRMVPIVGEIAWSDPEHDATTLAALHSWEPLDPFLFAHSYDPSVSLDAAVDYATQWLGLDHGPLDPDLGVAGRRAIRLAYLAVATGIPALTAFAGEQARALAEHIDPGIISPEMTDGITGLLALIGRHPGAEGVMPDAASAADAFRSHLEASFTSDGVHRSGSPGLHARVLDRITFTLQSGLVPKATVGPIRRRAEHALAWLIDPTGAPANFGTTTTEPISSAYGLKPAGIRALRDRIADPALLHAASAGRFGAPPRGPIEILDNSGFGVIKTPWPDRSWHRTASHLVLRAGHWTDENSGGSSLPITWHDRGRRLLVEPGPRVPTTTHPAGDYAADPASHNGVFWKGQAETRDDGELTRWGNVRGRLHLEARSAADHATHRRTVLLDPGQWLLIVDEVDVGSDVPVGIRFHPGDELGLMRRDDGYTLLDGADPVAWARPLTKAGAMTPERGETAPVPSGWWSPDGVRMVPNWVFGWDAVGPTRFVTLISLEGRPEPDAMADPWIGWHTAEHRIRVAVTEWGITEVVAERMTGEEHS